LETVIESLPLNGQDGNSHQQHEDTMTESLVPYSPPEGSLGIIREPEEILADAQKVAAALMRVVQSKKKQITFNGETYLESGDWQTVGAFHGVTAKVEWTRFVEYGDVRGFEAAAVAIDRNGREVSRGEAMCLNDEENWGMRAKYEWQDVLDAQGKKIWEFNAAKGKNLPKREKVQIGETATPLFQLRSMAQTRACAKALSNLFKWVVVLAGYKPTPAEEMVGTSEEAQDSPNTSHTTPSPDTGKTAVPTTASATATTMNGPKADTSATLHSPGEPDIRPRSQKGTQPPTQPLPTVADAFQGPQQAPQNVSPFPPEGETLPPETIITEKQRKMFFAISRSASLSDDQIKAALAKVGLHCHRDSIPKSRFQDALNAIDPDQRFHQNRSE
jgi:hypothetical protein